MKHFVTATICVAIVALLATPGQSLAQTLTVYASGPTLDQVILGDTTAAGVRQHTTYQLVSLDTTYIFDETITVTSDISVIGVPDAGTGRPPCIQPDVLPDNSVPAIMFSFNGNGINGVFQHLYLLGLAINNAPAPTMDGTAIQVSADNVRIAVDDVVFEEWLGFAIGYNGNHDKFFVTNSKFRNMVHPNQWYVGEVLRNEWPGEVETDSIVFRDNTMFCVNGYASAPVTKYYVTYFEFSHNSVIFTFKNPMFIFNVTDAKINNNIFYATYVGGVALPENPWWDNLWYPDEDYGVIALQPLDAKKDSVFAPEYIGNPLLDSLAEAKRAIEVKNNVCFWPPTLTTFWTAWNDTAHLDSIITPSWMNSRTIDMFGDNVHWPALVESGNQQVDPGFGASIPGVLTQATNGLLAWFTLCRTGQLTNTYWDYQKTQVDFGSGNWIPVWPLPEAADMQYSNTALQTGGTDGLPVGDPNWFGIVDAVEPDPGPLPVAFALESPYPNPFNPTTTLRYTLSESGIVNLTVCNILGQVIATVVDQAGQSAGTYTVSIDLTRETSGVYFAILEQGNNRAIQKLVLLK